MLLILALCCIAHAQAPSALGPQSGVLMLRNGELIAGTITFSGDRYDVGLEDGEIRIKGAEVEYCGRTVRDCFEHRCDKVEADKVDDRLNLAEWCVRQNMLEEAAGQLGEALRIDPTHPRIGLIERRIKLAIEQPGGGAAATGNGLPDTATLAELDRMVRSLPARSVETFTTTIQPMLLNRCSNAGCHGPQSSNSLRLLRISAAKLSSRRSTQRNLHSALTMVDRAKPDESKLLVAPTKPHGNAKEAIFTSRELWQYKQLVDWVHGVAASQPPAQPATLEEPASSLLQAVESATATEATIKPAESDSASESPSPSRAVSISHPRGPVKRGEQPQGFVPKDPFDPEIFNRKYFGRKSVVSGQ